MKLRLSLALSLTACAAAPRARAPVDPTALHASGERIAVRIDATGAVQGVAVVPEGTTASQNLGPDPWCTTPCTLHLTPGAHTLWTGAPAVLDAVTPLRVGARPITVRVRSAARPPWERGRNLLVGGIGMATVGAIFVAFSPLEVAGGSPTGPETVGVGVGLAVVGAVLMVLGVRGMNAQRPGVDLMHETEAAP